MNLLKRYIEKKNKRNYYKDYYYKNIFFAYDFFNRFKAIQAFKNEIFYPLELKFKGKIDFNASKEEVLFKLGKPRYSFEHEDLKHYQILHYKNKINDIKNRSQLHFYYDSFFYGVQLFPYLSSIQKQELIDLLRIKYAIPDNETLPFKIKDCKNNILFISDDLNFSLEYFTGNEDLLRSLFDSKNKVVVKRSLSIQKKKQALLDIL
ncbi:MAG: hypothetical protein ACUVQP_08165 [Bacteroidales bacterium]